MTNEYRVSITLLLVQFEIVGGQFGPKRITGVDPDQCTDLAQDGPMRLSSHGEAYDRIL